MDQIKDTSLWSTSMHCSIINEYENIKRVHRVHQLFLRPNPIKKKQEEVKNVEDFIWRMYIRYQQRYKIPLPFQCPIGQYDDAIKSLCDGTGILYFITLDCAQCYHQIRVWILDWDKLAFFAPDGGGYTYNMLPFGPVNTPPFVEQYFGDSKQNQHICSSFIRIIR